MNRCTHPRSLLASMSRLFSIVVLLMLGTQFAHAERKTTYYHTDGLGSVVAASDQSGALLWRKEYAPFGQQLDSTAENEKIAYTGKEHDDLTGLTYFGARFYDPYVGRFTSVDPVGFVESNPMSFNRYAYVNNNPYRYIDPDGRWPSQSGFYVHQRATYEVIGKKLPKSERRILANAHVIADAPQYQTGDSSHRHAMAGIGETAESAREKANAFVREQYEKAWNAPSRAEALKEFGIALHTLQDSTSPAHAGFQRWTGEESNGEIAKHVATELYNPGRNSNLYSVTADAWKWFNEKRLPKGDLFTKGAD
jgi:RHS repeat-associated protein